MLSASPAHRPVSWLVSEIMGERKRLLDSSTASTRVSPCRPLTPARSTLSPGYPWPVLLDEVALCRLVSAPPGDTRRMVAAGVLPVARMVCGLPRWHLQEVQSRLDEIFGLGMPSAEAARREAKKPAQEALLAFKKSPPAPIRRGGRHSRREPSVLPPRGP